jgi:hypothetical protein
MTPVASRNFQWATWVDRSRKGENSTALSGGFLLTLHLIGGALQEKRRSGGGFGVAD